MFLTTQQRSLIERIINTIETGTPAGDYSQVTIYADGPHGMRQITYGRAQTTEYGNLRKLVQMYVGAGGQFSAALAPYAPQVGSVPLTEDRNFRALLKSAGKSDPVMKGIQDQFFDEVYFAPAMAWASANGFTKALSALVIYDSFIHSGGILWFLRQRFAESPPASGGDEKRWIAQYVDTRHQWLSTHSKALLRASSYRTKAFLEQIAARNWDLARVPVLMNGTKVMPAA